ncbi:MAG: sodium:alanine symporter family protein [Oscillospiraceae bacterium]|jgi:AGCS family alanine or glycine:cation symporter|nr:sodium:alanine symporter family protein [Oscillospiraceae bacterium]
MWVVLLLAGLWFTLRSGFWQVFYIGRIFRETLGSLRRTAPPLSQPEASKGVTPFQAMSTALASTVGTGNIAGVATAIVAGGPGAIFWMWVSALLGMMTKYAEVFLAVKHRKKAPGGGFYGGPMYYMEAIGWKIPAVIFAMLCMTSALGVGNLTQINTLADAAYTVFHVPKMATAVVTASLAALVVLGGIRSVGAVTEKLVPFMSVLYIGLSAAVLIICRDGILPAFQIIVAGAFTPQAAFGGAAGYTVFRAMRYGVSRGVFTNEAGLGSAPIAHACADTDSPERQGMWGALEVFIDTIVLCTLTALVILAAGVFTPGGELDGAALTVAAFEHALGPFGAGAVAVCTALFAFATIPGWCFYGEQCCLYLSRSFRARRLGAKSEVSPPDGRWNSSILYRAAFIVLLLPGAALRLETVWHFADVMNALMALPNLAALLVMSRQVFAGLREL